MDLELTVVQRAKPELGYLAGLAVGDELVVAAGGTTSHTPTVLASSNARHFESCKTPRQLGLRDVVVVGDAIWTCGEYGQLAVSRDRGATWRVLETGTELCLFGLAAAADGAVWVVGDAGYVARVRDERLERIDIKTMTRLTAIYCMRDESIALGLDGVMYRWCAGVVTKIVTGATKQLTALAITHKGSWLVIGDGGFVARSPDGAWFSRVKVGVELDLEGIAMLPDGHLVMVGDRGTILVSADDGRTWAPVETDGVAHLWAVRPFGNGVLIGGDGGLILKLAPSDDLTWEDRTNVFGGGKPLDDVMAAGPDGFITRVPAYVAAAEGEAREVVAPSGDAFVRIYGVQLPAEVGALFAAAGGRDCFEELRLDATLISEVGDENLFERVLASGATDAFCGVFQIGSQQGGDTYHMEIYEWDGPRQVLHLDHQTRAFTRVVADSLDSLVYVTALVRADKRKLVSKQVFESGMRKLHGRVAPVGPLSLGDSFVPLDAKRRDTEFFFYRSRWICALLDGAVDVAEIPALFMPGSNQIVPPDQLQARLETCEHIIPTALYSMWRAYFFAEPELARYLEIGTRHKSRLVRDAATLIDELRAGRNALGTITDMRARLAAFRTLGLDPRGAAPATAQVTPPATVRDDLEAELRRTPRASWIDLAWRWIDDGVAQRVLLAKLAEEPELAAQVVLLDELRSMPVRDREGRLDRIAARLSPELEAILVGSIVRDDDLADALAGVTIDVTAARTRRTGRAGTISDEPTKLNIAAAPPSPPPPQPPAAPSRAQAALAMTRRALELDPSDETTEFTHAMLLLEAGKLEELVARWPSLSSQNQEALIDKVAPALHRACTQAHAANDFDVAVRLARHAQLFASSCPSLYHAAACAFAAVGDYARAFEQVKLAIENNADHVADIEVDSQLGPLLEWPEFKALFRDWHARKEGN